MRNLLTTAAMILALGAASPALADGYGQGFHHAGNVPPPAPAYEQTARSDRDMSAWERGWSPIREDARFGVRDIMTRAKLTRRLEQQGYFRVRDLTPGRFGNGWRATAVYHGQLVVVRLDGFTGRVLAARYI